MCLKENKENFYSINNTLAILTNFGIGKMANFLDKIDSKLMLIIQSD
jgi:hypothetical protein